MRLIRAILILSMFPLVTTQAAPPVEEIVKNVIAKIASDKQVCSTYVHSAIGKSIKYDKEMRPDEVTTLNKFVYHSGARLSEQVLSMDKDGKAQSEEEIRKKVAEQNEKWLDEQKEGKEKKAGSRDNYVDPLTEAGVSAYSYHLIETRDSTFTTVTSAVAGTKDIIDQSVQKLTTYYIIQARAKVEDDRHLNATYWVDAKTFGLLHSEFAPAKMPRFVEMLDFRMDYTIFRFGDADIYFPQRFELKGKAGFWFMKGRFGKIEEYSDYRCQEAIDESLLKERYFYKPEGGQ